MLTSNSTVTNYFTWKNKDLIRLDYSCSVKWIDEIITNTYVCKYYVILIFWHLSLSSFVHHSACILKYANCREININNNCKIMIYIRTLIRLHWFLFYKMKHRNNRLNKCVFFHKRLHNARAQSRRKFI